MIRKGEKGDEERVAELAALLWSDNSMEDMAAEFAELFSDNEACVFLKCEGERSVGFAQCQLRHDYVEGTESSPVGYLEAVFVREEFRRRGYAAELLRECERWAKEKGCTEFASDCELDNDDSFLFHMAMGFAEKNRIICFGKKLRP